MNLMHSYAQALFLLAILVAAPACREHASASKVEVTELPGLFVAPESCAAHPLGGWLVTEQGCGFEQPACRAQVEAGARLGSVIHVRPDGSRVTLISDLKAPNGVDVDPSGNIWVADGGAKELVVLGKDGGITRIPLPGAGLLNDVAAVPWSESAVWVSDTKGPPGDGGQGRVYLVGLDALGGVPTTYASGFDDGPNGVAPSVHGDGMVVAGVGDLALPGRGGLIHEVAPSEGSDPCSRWRGGATRAIRAPIGRKFDGLVQGARNGVEGYYASAIYSVGKGAAAPPDSESNGMTGEIWFVPGTGAPPELLVDVGKVAHTDAPVPISAADIGIDRKTGDICVPDLNGSSGVKQDKGAGARVFIVHQK